MKLPFTTISTTTALLAVLSSYALQQATASPQGIFGNKNPTNPAPEPEPEPEFVRLTIYPASANGPKRTLSFSMTSGLAIESLGMVTDVVMATVDTAPENTHCLFWRLNDEYQSFLDRGHVMAEGLLLASLVERAFGILCYDSTRPELLTGYADS